MFKRIRSERGFTLVELLIVLAIMAILVAIVVPNLAGLTGGARGTAARTELSVVQTAMDTLMSENEAVSVTEKSRESAAEVGSGTPIEYWKVTGIAPGTFAETTTSGTAYLRLRTTSTGTYSWTTGGAVTQEGYAVVP